MSDETSMPPTDGNPAAVPVNPADPGPESAVAEAAERESSAPASEPGASSGGAPAAAEAGAVARVTGGAEPDPGAGAADDGGARADEESASPDAEVEDESDTGTGGGPGGRFGALRRIDPGRMAGYLGAAVIGAILTGALLMMLGAIGAPAATASPLTGSPQATTDATPAASGTTSTAAPSAGAASALPVEGTSLGDPNAPVTIEIWSDFQCPYCSLLAHAIEPDLIRGPVASGEVQLVYSDYVFLGRESLDAAVAARCAGKQGQFWRFHDLLFALQQGENQGTFSAQFLVNIASFAGLDLAQFQACVVDPTAATDVMTTTEEGTAAGIQSTPTLVIKGPATTRVVRGFPSWSDLLLEIDRSMGRAPIPTPAPSGAATTPGPETSPGASAEPVESGASPAVGASPVSSASPGTAAPEVTATP